MKTSAKGLDLITRWEGLKLTKYICPAGKPTIGVGHVILPGEGIPDTITRDFAMQLLQKDVERFERAVNQLITVDLNQNQFDALVSFTFNVGEGGLKNTGVSKAVNEKRFSDVPAALRMWNKIRVNGVSQENKGLTNRRISEAELFMAPINNATVEVSTSPGSQDMVFIPLLTETIKSIQTKLKLLGLYSLKIDGIYGMGTKTGVETFARGKGISYTLDFKSGIRKDILDLLNNT
jgi:lysozyme